MRSPNTEEAKHIRKLSPGLRNHVIPSLQIATLLLFVLVWILCALLKYNLVYSLMFWTLFFIIGIVVNFCASMSVLQIPILRELRHGKYKIEQCTITEMSEQGIILEASAKNKFAVTNPYFIGINPNDLKVNDTKVIYLVTDSGKSAILPTV